MRGGVILLAHASPSNQAGVGYGALGINSNFDVGIGSSTFSTGVGRFIIVASSSSPYAVKVFSTASTPIFSVDNSGNVVAAGSLTAGSFVGNLSGTVTAGNLSAGTFGSNTGGGNYTFPSTVTASSYALSSGGAFSINASQINRTDGYVELQYQGGQGVRMFGSTAYPIVFTGAGLVGIGTTNPTTALAVVGNVSSTGLCLSGVCNTTWPTSGVSSVFGRTGVVTAASGDYSVAQVTGAAPLASPTFTGNVTMPSLIDNGLAALGSANIDPNMSGNSILSPYEGSDKLLVGWNRMGGTGEIDLLSARASSLAGGFNFYDYSAAGAATQVLRIDASGNVTAAGTIQSTSGGIKFPDGTTQTTAAGASGQVTSAGNISAGTFGSNTGGGNYSFPANIIPSTVSNSGGSAWYLGGGAWTGEGPAVSGIDSVTGLMYAGGSGSQLFTLSSASGQASLQLDGSVFVGDGLSYNPIGMSGASDGYLDVQNSDEIGGSEYVQGSAYIGGNVGIGTTAPGYTLDVRGSSGVIANIGTQSNCCSSNATLGLSESTSVNNRLAWLQFHDSGDQEGFLRLASNTRMFEMGDDQGVGMDLALLNGGGTRNIILYGPTGNGYFAGNVGIGTAAPESILQVVGNSLDVSPTGGNFNEGIRIHSSSNGYSDIQLGAVSGETGTGVGQWSIEDNPSPYTLGFWYDGNQYFNITDSGNVGIGTTAPASTLSVGSAGYSGYGISGTGSDGIIGVGTGTSLGTGVGVYGASTANGYGVEGVSSYTGAAAVFGDNNSGGYGVEGLTNGLSAVLGANAGGAGTYGINGEDYGGTGVYGYGATGVYGSGTANDFVGSGGEYARGGDWYNASARYLKENFTPINDQTILSKIVELPITQWNYKSDKDALHIGPVAEDFYSIFGLGDSSTSISTIDPSGIALVGVKALDENVSTQQTQITELQTQVSALHAQNATLQKEVGELLLNK